MNPSIHAQSQPGRAAAIILVFHMGQEQLGEKGELIRRTPLGAVPLCSRPLTAHYGPKQREGVMSFFRRSGPFGRMLGYNNLYWHRLRIQTGPDWRPEAFVLKWDEPRESRGLLGGGKGP